MRDTKIGPTEFGAPLNPDGTVPQGLADALILKAKGARRMSRIPWTPSRQQLRKLNLTLSYIEREANNPSGGDPVVGLKEIDRMVKEAISGLKGELEPGRARR